MGSAALLTDAFTRIRDLVHEVVAGLGPDELAYRVDEQANSIGWLVWHLTRVQDGHLAELLDQEQVWTADDWYGRFGLPYSPGATGYGQRSADVGRVRVESPDLLTGYHDAVCERTLRYVATMTDADLDRIVDKAWTPPVTLGVRLISVVSDDLQHAGQAALVRGVVERRR